MEQFLHLFTSVSQGLPEKTGYYLVIFNNEITPSYYLSSIKVFKVGTSIVTHWLDLSKLTTKERALDAISGAVDCIDEYVVEYHDSTSEIMRKEIKEIKRML